MPVSSKPRPLERLRGPGAAAMPARYMEVDEVEIRFEQRAVPPALDLRQREAPMGFDLLFDARALARTNSRQVPAASRTRNGRVPRNRPSTLFAVCCSSRPLVTRPARDIAFAADHAECAHVSGRATRCGSGTLHSAPPLEPLRSCGNWNVEGPHAAEAVCEHRGLGGACGALGSTVGLASATSFRQKLTSPSSAARAVPVAT